MKNVKQKVQKLFSDRREKRALMTKGYLRYRRNRMLNRGLIIFFQLSILALFLGLWEGLTTWEVGRIVAHDPTTAYQILDPWIFSNPSRIWATFGEWSYTGMLWTHIWASLSMVLLGFVISMVAGTVIALLLYQSKTVRRIFEPYLSVLNAIPKIALAPMLLIWTTTSTSLIIWMCLLVCIFVTIISMLSAFLQVDEGKKTLMRTMGANRLQMTWKLVLPASIPAIISVAKINVGLAWIGVILGEFTIAGGNAGLGWVINTAPHAGNYDFVMAAIVLLSIISGIMYYIVATIERFIKRHDNN